MKIWDLIRSKKIETPTEMNAFFSDIVDVYKKHGLSIAHEDYHGAFIVEPYSELNVKWLKSAHKGYRKKDIKKEKRVKE